MKVLLRGVLIDRLPALDAVELGGCSFFASLGESYWSRVVRIPIRYCGRLSSALVNPIATVIGSCLRL